MGKLSGIKIELLQCSDVFWKSFYFQNLAIDVPYRKLSLKLKKKS